MGVAELLARDASEIIDSATEVVIGPRSGHYAKEGREAARAHVEELYGCLLACLEGPDATRMIEHARAIARKRFESGFGLHEVLTAINVIEEDVWLRLETQLPAGDFARAIRIVSSILGMAKDTLASDYVDLAARAHAQTLDLERLFGGTDGV
jgi:hypothetical protein